MTRSRSIVKLLRAGLLRRPIVFILAALIAVLFDVFAMGRTVLPLTLPSVTPAGPYGYDGPRPEQPNSVSIDPAGAYDAEYAWAAYAARSIRSGALPFWNPYQGLGQPLLANYVSGVIYPVNWLTLILPPAWWDLVFITDWFLAAYFVYLLGRVLGVNRQSAAVGSLAVLAAGFFEGFLAVKSIIGTVAWFPFLIYAIERTLLQPDWKWRHVALVGGTYCLGTAGHPAPALMGVVFVVVYAVARVAVARGSWRPIAFEILPSILVGGLLAAPLWVPFAEHVLHDGVAVHGDDQGTRHFPWRGLPLLMFPFLYGPLNLDIWGSEHAGLAWNPASVTFLAMCGLFALFASRPVKTRRFVRHEAGIIALTLVVGLAAAKIFGVPIINDIGRLPLLDQFSFTYANGFVAVGLCALAGLGFAQLVRRPARQWRGPLFVWGISVVAMLAIGVATVEQSEILTREAWRRAHFHTALAAGLGWAIAFPGGLLLAKLRSPGSSGPMLLVATGGLLLQAIACFPSGSPRGFVIVNIVAAAAFCSIVAVATWRGARMRSPIAVTVTVLVAAAALAMTDSIKPRLPGRYNPLTRAPYIRLLAHVPNAPRLYPLDGILFPNFAAPFGLSSMTNLDNLVTRQGAAFFTRFLDAGVHPARFYGMDAARNPGWPDPVAEFRAHRRYWDLVGVRYLLTADRDLNTHVVTKSPVSGAVGVPVSLVAPLEARVMCSAGSFDTVSVLTATYARRQPGRAIVDVLDLSGAVFASAEVDSTTLTDNDENRFKLSAPACGRGEGEVVLRLSFRPGAPGAMIAAWQYPAWQGAGFVYRALRTPDDGDSLRLIYRDPRTGVRVWENPRAADRAFLAPNVVTVPDADDAMARLDGTPDLRRTVFVDGEHVCRGDESFPPDAPPGRLISLRLSPNRVEIQYDARTLGVLTLTDAHARGWRARVDGREAPVLRVDGVFRGVCIDAPGVHEVDFIYRPPNWWLALTLFGAGAIGLAALVVTRRGTRAHQ